ncbi:helix-turn-helix domain-containing protein [Dolosicoccus paucivorans]|uniref:XRE family transcriptional regulator n=1 Tax=Dolosicoccus paucivorans TaxID=84521 RepID=A0A1G8P5J2_9LACT|nr:helix-turn-helix transcriptional regulator [Dolosicoccus paucivorans]PMB83929.1 XRE family transcriptional regulator [Dolosicoccus paucivorans]PMC58136.1 XRE family transcriptional regulator [Dolosicoccus paucivorans]SDI87702.1 Helix-turn-helix [Dolosicoccus paucivorans]
MTNNLIATISKIIKTETGYSIAQNIGVRPEQINRLKRGERKVDNISLDMAQKILDYYANVTIDIK